MATRKKRKSRQRPAAPSFGQQKTSGLRWVLRGLVLLSALGLLLYLLVLLPLQRESTAHVMIAPGSSVREVGGQLQQQGVIRSSLVFRVWARVTGSASRLQAGAYDFRGALSLADVVRQLRNGAPAQLSFTLIEGWSVSDVLAQLWQQPSLNPDALPEDADTLGHLLGLEGSAEGWLAPETYAYLPEADALAFLQQTVQRQRDLLDVLWAERQAGLPYRTPYDALIMASIVEKETGAASERARIAGVFVGRLQKGMRLQTDPSVIYGMGSRYQGNLSRADLLRKTPWNTYRIDGLPPTPISNPGRAAIEAALHPLQDGALYFVARGDGSHVFARTLAEHNRNVARFQKQRREGYQSQPQ